MRFLIFGAGAVGGLVGGKLALAGQAVTFLARPAVAQAIASRGLRISEGAADVRVPPARAVTTVAEAFRDWPDCVIVTVKSYDTAGAIEQLRELPITPPPILSFQNGVDNETILVKAFGPEHVFAGTVTSSVTMDEPGTIIVERSRGVGVAVDRPFGKTIARALAAAGLATQTYADAVGMKWSKMLVNLMGNATSAICSVGTGEVFDHPGLYQLEVAALRECLAVMHAKGIPVVNLPRTPAAWLAAGLRYLPAWALKAPLRYTLKDARGGKMPSFREDLMRGRRRSEVSWLNGAVVRHGAQADIATPVNRLLTETLEGILEGRVNWEEYRGRPERLAAAGTG